MKISIITLFPEVFSPILNSSILGRAQKKGKVSFEFVNLRDFGEGTHKTVDDKPFGGGVGMVLKANVLAKAWESIVQGSEFRVQGNRNKNQKSPNSQPLTPRPLSILMSASGVPYSQQKAKDLSKLDHLIIICGHYEGVDQRFIEKYVDEEFSVGDYVLTGGEIPAMVVVDSICRLIPGVLAKPEAIDNESFSNSSLVTLHSSPLLEHPHYTRPQVFEGEKVPDVLTSGNHQEIKKWCQEKSIEKTRRLRPDLIKN